MNIQSLFSLRLTGLILQSKGLLGVFSSTPIWKYQFFDMQPSLCSNSHICIWLQEKTIAFIIWTSVDKVMSLLFNTIFYVCHHFPSKEQVSFNYMAAVTICNDFESKKIKSVTVSTFPFSVCHGVMGPDVMTLVFWRLSFKLAFLLSSFTLIKQLFSSSSLSAITCISEVSSAYLRLLVFLLAILISACDSTSPAFYKVYFAYKLNKQGDSIQPCRTPFLIWNQSVVSCPVLIVASWPSWSFPGDS